MANSADPDQKPLIWIYTVCKGRAYPGSAGLGLKLDSALHLNCQKMYKSLFQSSKAHLTLKTQRNAVIINVLYSKKTNNKINSHLKACGACGGSLQGFFLVVSYLLYCCGWWILSGIITKTCLYDFDPLNPTFILRFTGVYIIFLILLKSIDCGYSLELPH